MRLAVGSTTSKAHRRDRRERETIDRLRLAAVAGHALFGLAGAWTSAALPSEVTSLLRPPLHPPLLPPRVSLLLTGAGAGAAAGGASTLSAGGGTDMSDAIGSASCEGAGAGTSADGTGTGSMGSETGAVSVSGTGDVDGEGIGVGGVDSSVTGLTSSVGSISTFSFACTPPSPVEPELDPLLPDAISPPAL